VVSSGNSFLVEAVLGGADHQIKYNWRVTGGKLVNGQGTKLVLVNAGKPGNIHITVDLGTQLPDLCADCPRQFSKDITVNPK
jgi:hypothetical protein